MKQNKGSAFFMVILALVILSLLGAVFLTLSVSNAKTLARQNNSRQAYYIAKSGADAVSRYIINDPDTDTDLVGRAGAENDDFPNGTYKVEVTGSVGPVSSNLEVKGTATVNGVTETATAVMRRMTYDDFLENAIYSESALNIEGMRVIGNTQSAGSIAYSVNGSHKYTGTAKHDSPKSISVIFPKVPAGDHISDIILTGHSIKTVSRNVDTTYDIDRISIDQQSQLTIEANNCVVNLVIDHLSVKNIIEIKTSGNGVVNFFINDRMEIKTKGYINNTAPKNLNIYLEKNSVFDMQANITLNGYVIGPEADVIIQSSQSQIRGAVFARGLTKNGAGNPNGEVIYMLEQDPGEIPEHMKGYIISEWKD